MGKILFLAPDAQDQGISLLLLSHLPISIWIPIAKLALLDGSLILSTLLESNNHMHKIKTQNIEQKKKGKSLNIIILMSFSMSYMESNFIWISNNFTYPTSNVHQEKWVSIFLSFFLHHDELTCFKQKLTLFLNLNPNSTHNEKNFKIVPTLEKQVEVFVIERHVHKGLR